MCKFPCLSHDVTELKQRLTRKALRSVKAASLLDTHQRSPNRVPQREHSTTLNLEHPTQQWTERVEATSMKVIFLDAMSLRLSKKHMDARHTNSCPQF